VNVSNGVQQEIHYIQLEDEEDLEAYHAGDWDYETELDLQLDYTGRDMLGDFEEITYEVYQQHRHIAHGDAEIIDAEPDAADPAAGANPASGPDEVVICEHTGCERTDTCVHSFGCIALCGEHGLGQCVGTSEQDNYPVCEPEAASY
jgi:hypothetical protein